MAVLLIRSGVLFSSGFNFADALPGLRRQCRKRRLFSQRCRGPGRAENANGRARARVRSVGRTSGAISGPRRPPTTGDNVSGVF